MIKHRIKAFTILEVTITMLITAILIAITYTSYSIVIKSYHSFTKKNDEIAGLDNLDHLLKRDFDQAEIILRDTDGIVLSDKLKVIKYVFEPDFIIRNAVRIDTFKMQTKELITSFENIPVNEIQNTEEQNRIDELGFISLYQNEKIPYHYHKSYSSENMIKRNPNAIN